MVKTLQRLLELIFALFLVYLLLTRGFLSWLQFAPDHFTQTAQDLFSIEVTYDDLQVDQHWLGFEFEASRLALKTRQYQLESARVSADINLIGLLLPFSVGEYFHIEDGTLSTQIPLAFASPNHASQFDFHQLQQFLAQPVSFHSGLANLWQQISVDDFRIIDQQNSEVGLHIRSLEWVNSTRLSLVSEFAIQYKQLLDYQPMSLTVSASQNAVGRFGKARANLISYRPVDLAALGDYFPIEWQSKLPNGKMMFEVQADFERGTLAKLNANLQGNGLVWQTFQQNAPRSIGMEVLFQAQNAQVWGPQKWTASLSKFHLDNDALQGISPINLDLSSEELVFSVDQLDLSPLIASFKGGGDRSNRAYQVKQFALKDLQGQMIWDDLQLTTFQFTIDQAEFQLANHGVLQVKEAKVKGEGQHYHFNIKQPALYQNPNLKKTSIEIAPQSAVRLDYGDAENWRLSPIGLKVDEVPLSVDNLQLHQGHLTLKSSTEFDSVNQLTPYLPFYLMGEAFQEWFEMSEVNANKLQVNMSIEAPLNELFTSGGGLKLSGQFENASLRFDRQWPRIQNVDARFSMEDYQLRLKTAAGLIFPEITAKNVTVMTTDLRQSDIALEVMGEVETQIDQAIGYLQATPLLPSAEVKQFITNDLTLSGKTEVQLNALWIPVHGFEGQTTSVDVTASLKGIDAQVFDFPKFHNLTGQLKITEDALSATTLVGDFLQGPIELSANADRQALVLEFVGKARDSKQQIFADLIPWSTQLTIPFLADKPISFASKVHWQSGRSRLPAPLSSKELMAPLSINGTVSEDKLDLQIAAQDVGLAKLFVPLVDNQESHRVSGDVFLGAKANYPPLWKAFQNRNHAAEQSLNINGFIEKLSVDQWLAFYEEIKLSYASNEGQNALDFDLEKGKLIIRDLGFKDYLFPESKINWSTQQDSVRYQLSGVNANIEVVHQKDNSFDVNVDSIILNPQTSHSVEASQNRCRETPSKVIKIPLIRFKAANVQFKDYALKDLSFNLVPHPQGYAATGIAAQLGEGVGKIKGAYSFNHSPANSSLVLFLNSNKVQALTHYLGINKGFKGESASGKIQVGWVGDIACFDTQKLQGPINVTITQGKVDDVEPGLARLLGLLSIDSLVRRLQLDLKDVTNKGFAFDSISAKGRFNQSIVRLDKLEIDAPSVDTQVTGDILLNNETFDMKALVTPAVGSSLTTLAAIAGAANPLAAIAIYALMKALPEINEELITFEYDITGPWSDPKLEIVNQVENFEEDF